MALHFRYSFLLLQLIAAMFCSMQLVESRQTAALESYGGRSNSLQEKELSLVSNATQAGNADADAVLTPAASKCKPSGQLHAPKRINKKCKDCCKPGKAYPQFKCSPPISKKTPATLTVNGFGKGEEGGGAAACDGKYHSNKDLIVALSTGWFDKRSRCGKSIVISANNKKVKAKVVDECDSLHGCDDEHGFQPPCPHNIVDASPEVWRQLGIPPGSKKFGWTDVTWADA